MDQKFFMWGESDSNENYSDKLIRTGGSFRRGKRMEETVDLYQLERTGSQVWFTFMERGS